MSESNMIYGLIGQAMREIGAIGKNSKNQQQGFMYRGVDAVYNALNPVMAKLGLFLCPEVLEQTREERVNRNGTTLLYSILKIKYTLYAPDGSNVSCIVLGEGMDSGDKASNKAMSVAMKYAAFQLFMIPTEELCDPDAETHEVAPKTAKNAMKPAPAVNRNAPAQVTTAAKVPTISAQAVTDATPAAPASPVLEYLAKEREALRVVREIGKAENNAIWRAQVQALTVAKLVPAKPLTEYTQSEAEYLVAAMYKNFSPKGTVLKDDGKPA